jgi:hypothetical protein
MRSWKRLFTLLLQVFSFALHRSKPMRNYPAKIIRRSIRLCRFHATPSARSSYARGDVPPPPPPLPPTLAIRDYLASMTDRSIHLGKFPATTCARSSHACAHMHAAAVAPPPLCPAAFEPQVAPTLAGASVKNPEARAGWMNLDGGDLVMPVSSPIPPLSFPSKIFSDKILLTEFI